jgi:two-component system chemotaxis response regulator CheB
MPGLDGLQTLHHIMKQFPRPVIMVSSLTEKGADRTFNALAAGAFDYIPKQLSPESLDIHHIRADLVAKIHAAAHSRRAPATDVSAKKPPHSHSESVATASLTAPAIVAVGSSTGGPKALEDILPLFPRDLSVPILIVQHMPAGFTAPFAQRLNTLCAVKVREASDGEAVQPGVVYIAPAGRHMRVALSSGTRATASRAFLSLNPQPEDYLHIPSVNILMNSVAAAFKNLALGVILTGMGSDGAEGMQAIHRQGGFTIGQDQATCTVYGMPKACAELGILSQVLPLEQIPAQILQATRYRKRA